MRVTPGFSQLSACRHLYRWALGNNLRFCRHSRLGSELAVCVSRALANPGSNRHSAEFSAFGHTFGMSPAGPRHSVGCSHDELVKDFDRRTRLLESARRNRFGPRRFSPSAEISASGSYARSERKRGRDEKYPPQSRAGSKAIGWRRKKSPVYSLIT